MVGLAAGALSLGGFAAPALAQPIAVSNLVNVQISNVANNNDVVVQVPVNAAANICGVDISVLTSMEAGDAVQCEARGNQRISVTQ